MNFVIDKYLFTISGPISPTNPMFIIIHQYFNDDSLGAINLGSISRLDVDRYFYRK